MFLPVLPPLDITASLGYSVWGGLLQFSRWDFTIKQKVKQIYCKEQKQENQKRKVKKKIKGVEWNRDDDVEHMWEQVKWAMVESAREVCGSVRVGGKNPKSVVEQ